MEQPSTSSGATVVRIRTAPSSDVVELFPESFPRHPVSRLDRDSSAAFLASYAQHATLLVASDGALGDVGFLIGGLTATLDRTRLRFILRHALRIAAASAQSHTLRQLVLPRLKPAKSFDAARYALHQLRFIAVAPHAQGHGIGAQLVEAFESTLDGEPGYHTWTMAGERGAEAFFRRVGFTADMVFGDHLRMYKAL